MRARRAAAAAGLLRVAVSPNELARARVGLVVRRAQGGAVARNRIRRRLRALLLTHLGELRGLDVVVSAAAGAATAHREVLARDLSACLTAARRRLAPRVTGAARP